MNGVAQYPEQDTGRRTNGRVRGALLEVPPTEGSDPGSEALHGRAPEPCGCVYASAADIRLCATRRARVVGNGSELPACGTGVPYTHDSGPLGPGQSGLICAG
jgi:hypothetical protein